MGRIFFDILGLLNFLNESFKKVNSLSMDGAVSHLCSELRSNHNPRDILEIFAIWEGRGVLSLFPMEKCDRAPVYWSDGQNIKQNKKIQQQIYILILSFSDIPLSFPYNNRPLEWNCVSFALGRCGTLYHLIKIPIIGFCMLSTLRSRSRHLLSALMLASILLFTTFIHYILI